MQKEHHRSVKTVHFFFLRHAEKEYAALGENLIGGRSSHIGITPRGKLQSRLLAAKLRREGVIFDALFSSPSTRALQTAEILSEEMKLKTPLVLREELEEQCQGAWTGRPRPEVYTTSVRAQMDKLGADFTPPNGGETKPGESQRQVMKRVMGFVNKEILAKADLFPRVFPNQLIVGLVGHGNSIKCFHTAVMKSDPRLICRTQLDNCAISEFLYQFSGPYNGWHPISFNNSDHIPLDQRSANEF